MVRMVKTGALHNGAATSYRCEHLYYGKASSSYQDPKPRKKGKKPKQQHKRKSINLRDGKGDR